MSSWNSDSNLAAHMRQQRHAELQVERSATSSTHPTLDEPSSELGSFRQWWSDRPVLSVVVMFVAPVLALLSFMALY